MVAPRSFLAPCLSVACVLNALLTAGSAKESLANHEQMRGPSVGEQALLGPKSAQFRYDPRMLHAARIALQRAHPQTTWHCWRYVKDALLAADLVSSRPSSAWAKQAGDELCSKFGFRKLNITDPLKAPVGSVIVYGGADAGHVELRSADGFVSDFISKVPYPRPLIGIFVKRAE